MTRLSTLLVVGLLSLLGCSVYFLRRERSRNRAIGRSHHKLETDMANIMSNLSSGLMIVSRRGMIERVNPAAARILGVDEAALDAKAMHDVLQPGHFEFARSVAHVLSGGEQILRREIEIRTSERTLPIGVSVSPLGDEDDVQGAVAIFQDLSDVKRLRRQKRESDRLAALGELSAGIAHEIRNPLGSIRGCAEMLAGDAEAQGRDPRLLNLILKESRRVNRIISDFLTFARQPATRPTLVVARDLLEEVALMSGICENGFTGKARVGVRAVPDDMLLYVDEGQIKQVMLNLCQNACDAAGDSGDIRLEAVLDVPEKLAYLRVRDNGPGVPLQDLEKIFEPFHTTKKTGTGLGLAIARRIAVAHRGDLSVRNAKSGGAVFTLSLPLSDSRPTGDRDLVQDLIEESTIPQADLPA